MKPVRRALVVTHYWAPHVGGVETVAAEQVSRLAGRGWGLDVFTSRLGQDALERRDGAAIHRYRCINRQEHVLNVPVPLMSPLMLRDMVQIGSAVDVVVTHGHAYVGSLYAAIAARRLGRPLVVVQHNPFVDYPKPVQTLERFVDATLGRWILRQASSVVCVSRHTEAYVRAIAPGVDTRVIYSGVDTDRFSPGEPAAVPVRPTVLTVRRLVPRNGVDVLVRGWVDGALGRLGDLRIVGDGPEGPALRRMAGSDPSIQFLGRLPDEALAAAYRDATLFVLPSVSGEGFGLVAAEALASGLPVVTTDGGATAELVRAGTDGLVVRRRDATALAEGIRSLLAGRALLDAMRAAAIARRPELGWEQAITSLEAVLLAA